MELTEKDKRASFLEVVEDLYGTEFLVVYNRAIGKVLGPTRDDLLAHDRLVIKLLELVESSETEEEALGGGYAGGLLA